MTPTSASHVVLTGNPNSGKTTIFNALTGLRARVGNYAGVTVERKEGRFHASPPDLPIIVLDLPGTYSLSPQSLDEQIARDVLLQRLPDVPAPAVVVVVVDGSNLERNLYFATQVIELGHPTIIALNMMDVAENIGHQLDSQKLSLALGTPVVQMSANVGAGLKELEQQIIRMVRAGPLTSSIGNFCEVPPAFDAEIEKISNLVPGTGARGRALLFLSDAKSLSAAPFEIRPAIISARERLEKAGMDWRSAAIEGRYAKVAAIQRSAVTESATSEETTSDKIDAIVTHKVWGMLVFIGIMALMFLSIFTFAQLPMDLISTIFTSGADWLHHIMPAGDLESLLEGGVIMGVGAVVAFLPQICLLFLFIGMLEDSGYMARAAFLMDRMMSKVGLHGKSFIPMLSSFACAIPGIMATRTIETPKDRLVTILVAPLMSCSARLPVYTLLIGACIAGVWMKSLTMLSMYLLGIVVALGMAWLFKKTLLKGETPMLVMELPPYRRPVLKVVLRHMWDRSKLFLQRAGTVILGINILLWFLVNYPTHPEIKQEFAAKHAALLQSFGPAMPLTANQTNALEELDAQRDGQLVQNSFAGHAGKLLEPAIAPLGFDWKMGIGILSSFAAREVFVSTMSIVYSAAHHASEDEGQKNQKLQKILARQQRPNGSPIYTPLTAISLMVFYVLALQCVSTVAVVRRETNSWKWPVFQWVYMGVLAWVFAFVTYQGGRLLGFR
jgi:ferrous iron transport protein B